MVLKKISWTNPKILAHYRLFMLIIWTESEFVEFEPRLKSARNRWFQLNGG